MAEDLSALVRILEEKHYDEEYNITLQKIMEKDFEKAIPYIQDYLDLKHPKYPRVIDVALIERLDDLKDYELFLEDLKKISDGSAEREKKLKDAIPRVIQASDLYDKRKVDWLISQEYR